MPQPQFPLYIPSKSRADTALTPRFLDSIGVPYRLVVEQQQFDAYAAHFDESKLLVLDPHFQETYETLDDLGDSKSKGPGPARNFIWEHSKSEGHDWHWVMDDNIQLFARLHQNQRIPVGDGTIFAAMEDFVLRYRNVGMAGPNYWMFAPSRQKQPPFVVGTRIYSCNLIRNDLPYRWRGRYNEDTILSLDMLKSGWQTVQFNAFLQYKVTTQTLGGGNTEAFYAEEGTLPKSQMLVDAHSDVSKVVWKFGRWHHHVDYREFAQMPLQKRDDWVPPTANPYKLKKVETETSAAIPMGDTVVRGRKGYTPDDNDSHPLVAFYRKTVDRSSELPAPRFPIYIPTRGRADIASTPRLLRDAGTPFILVLEEQDVPAYRREFPDAEVLVLPESNQGIIYARNAIKDDAKQRGADYHWQIDDDVRRTYSSRDAKETPLRFERALAVAEECVDAFDGIGAIGLRHMAFSRTERHDIGFNRIVYSIQLLSTATPVRFREETIEDVDNSLQLLSSGLCTVVLNRLVYATPSTGTEKGGNTDFVHTADSRERRARHTAELWPGAFKLRETNVGVKLGPSRIWATFPQRPTPKLGK